MRTFTFELRGGKTKVMEFDEFVRWACLIEGIQKVDEKLQQAKVPDSDNSWVKPLAFEKYIRERFPAMKHDLTVEATLGNL
jgi:hypothetical protein|tara:strand:+ start:9221 stop:9463 length:243 start_codon:yes stop_codon:yes gene_type:complete